MDFVLFLFISEESVQTPSVADSMLTDSFQVLSIFCNGELKLTLKYGDIFGNMCTFFEKIVKFGYDVQNMRRILCADFKPFLTKTGFLRAI